MQKTCHPARQSVRHSFNFCIIFLVSTLVYQVPASKPLAPAGTWKAPPREEIRQKTFETFGFYPCLWQIRVVEAILKHDRDVISIAATGSGKTLTFWMPLLCHKGGIQMVVTPLNLLGTLNVDDLVSKGFTAIAISAEKRCRGRYLVN